MLALCRAARQRLDVCTFIWGNDEVGIAVAKSLMDAAGRGARTRLIVDGIGSLRLARHRLDQLRAAGVEVVSFMPLRHNPMRGQTNLRNHRKLAVADSTRLWAGGRNLAAEYFIDRPGHPAWMDLSFTAEGPITYAAHAQFDHDWCLASKLDKAMSTLPVNDMKSFEGPAAQWIPTGPDYADDTIYALLLTAAYQATQRILAVTPYFVPDDALLDAWCIACRRGVHLCLIVPARSNHRLADLARERALRRLAAVGAEVRLAKTMVHAKAVVIDANLGLCGTVNLDNRSLFLNYEVMTAFYDAEQIQWLAEWIGQLAEHSNVHDGARVSFAKDVLEGIVRSLAFQL